MSCASGLPADFRPATPELHPRCGLITRFTPEPEDRKLTWSDVSSESHADHHPTPFVTE
jgi:hypothetical protein